MALVTDEQDLEVVAGEPARLVVHLRDQRAGRVDRARLQPQSVLVHRRRHAVRREHDRRALRHLVGLVDEDRPALLERAHDVHVVHDLLAHVDRGAVEVERLLDGLHGSVDAGAVATRCSEQDALGGVGHVPMVSVRVRRLHR
ncbi:hypothetical protein GCM10025868_13460 [Angustibacter aerolatus]|uniref:Uncharacterized protein n=1 Tax=Angustibacter aerolatus TaxID=1162965 RepID=A0ABQ6JD32_9ACTN|nr:hypothetical protein GCM10025868_13460 [Angustibacter aerolatus]